MHTGIPCQDGFVVSVTISHMVVHGFGLWLGYMQTQVVTLTNLSLCYMRAQAVTLTNLSLCYMQAQAVTLTNLSLCYTQAQAVTLTNLSLCYTQAQAVTLTVAQAFTVAQEIENEFEEKKKKEMENQEKVNVVKMVYFVFIFYHTQVHISSVAIVVICWTHLSQIYLLEDVVLFDCHYNSIFEEFLLCVEK